MGRSNKRFVVLTDTQMRRAVLARSACNNPLVWPLVAVAIDSTLRQRSLRPMRWSPSDLETRRDCVWAKGTWMDAQMPPRAIAHLQALPRGSSEKVFDMPRHVVNSAWERLREKSQLTRCASLT